MFSPFPVITNITRTSIQSSYNTYKNHTNTILDTFPIDILIMTWLLMFCHASVFHTKHILYIHQPMVMIYYVQAEYCTIETIFCNVNCGLSLSQYRLINELLIESIFWWNMYILSKTFQSKPLCLEITMHVAKNKNHIFTSTQQDRLCMRLRIRSVFIFYIINVTRWIFLMNYP